MNLNLLRRASDASPLRRASDGRAFAAADAAVLRSDAYVEELLASREPAVPPADLDPEVRNAADLLAAALVRFHPSFRFEEELASRLRRLTASTGGPRVALLDGGRVVTLQPTAAPTAFSAAPTALSAAPTALSAAPVSGEVKPLHAADARGARDDAHGQRLQQADVFPRQVLMGGAIASGVSLAGVALVAWRLGGPAGIVRRARAAGDTLLAPGRAVPALAAMAGSSAREEAG